jgi:hypothetical protein
MLKENGIDKSKIFVYVANQEEYDEYIKVLDKGLYNKLIIGEKGIVPQRRFISRQWAEGKNIVSFDDDVKKVDLKMSKYKTLDAFFKDAFIECRKQKVFIWGVYPVYNPFFRKDQMPITTCLNYIVAAFYGYINRPNLKAIRTTLTEKTGQKEDVEMSLRYFIHDGIVLRFNKVGFITKYYGSSGGLGTFEERLKPMLEASKVLKKHFPEYGEIMTKKTGMTEFRLKKIPAHTVPPSTNNKVKTLKNVSNRKNKTVRK